MNYRNLIYTEEAQCQDCYKCVRECPVKAIKIENGHANIVEELCVLCGRCVGVCPAGAKRFRDDLNRVRQLIKLKPKVFASLAPSFVSEFPDLPPQNLIRALKNLGFCGVSETALGAQEVSAHVAERLKDGDAGVSISSACPVIVDYVRKYHPNHADRVTDLLSPVLAHCRLLREIYGDDIAIVFIGPCIAKKKEADQHPELLDVAITFDGLRRWMADAGVDPAAVAPTDEDVFVPKKAEEGALYPIDGGMSAGIRSNCSVNDGCFMTFSGLRNIERAMEDLDELPAGSQAFLELLGCEGGCVNGPCTAKRAATIKKRHNVINYTKYPQESIPRPRQLDITTTFDTKPVERKEHDEAEITEILHTVGKHSAEDELNCGGCGYDTCREFAAALLDGKAEQSMCVTYMRELAHKKANALINTMPSGAVIVDDKLAIVECNKRFAQMLGEEAMLVYEACPTLEGAMLEKVIPFAALFRRVLESGELIVEKDIRLEHAVLHVSIFTIEKHRIVGGIIQDITVPFVQKEQIVNKAREVIRKNLSTVQQIAYLLGENAAESEVILNSIINSFSPETDNG